MQNQVFHIQNLQCQYISGKTVLEIDQLSIQKGDLIFLLGPSGVGKSTFIETLGLMNKTIAPNENTIIEFYPTTNQMIPLQNAWQQPDIKLSNFRNQYFSFIFQNTNLMPNFTAGENMCVSRLINGTPLSEAKKEVLEVMSELELAPEIFDKKVTELSGGQRQRLAFVRAVIANFSVLFGDEPTGNLDKKTAFKLMQILKTYLLKQNRTGIIVSHDVDLALAFADKIFLLESEQVSEKVSIGKILKQNILTKKNEQWRNAADTILDNPSNFINNRF